MQGLLPRHGSRQQVEIPTLQHPNHHLGVASGHPRDHYLGAPEKLAANTNRVVILEAQSRSFG